MESVADFNWKADARKYRTAKFFSKSIINVKPHAVCCKFYKILYKNDTKWTQITHEIKNELIPPNSPVKVLQNGDMFSVCHGCQSKNPQSFNFFDDFGEVPPWVNNLISNLSPYKLIYIYRSTHMITSTFKCLSFVFI